MIIYLDNVHRFNALKYILWILSKKITSAYFTMLMPQELRKPKKTHISLWVANKLVKVFSFSFFIATNLTCGMCFEKSNTKNMSWLMGDNFGLSKWYLISRYLVKHELGICVCWCDIAPLFSTLDCNIFCYHFWLHLHFGFNFMWNLLWVASGNWCGPK